jgi:small nuclear ribonucleoprotein (snRNP)-like protein
MFSLFAIGVTLPGTAKAQTSSDTVKAQQNRASIEKLATNREKKVEVTLTDKTKVKGYITAIDANSFTVSDSKSGTGQTINFAEVMTAKRAGGGLSTKTWLIIGGVAAGTIVTWAIVKPAFCDGGAQTRGIC